MTSGSFAVNPAISRFILAQAKREDGSFVVDSFSTDGGTYPSDPPRECIDYIFAWRDGVPCEVIEARVLNRSGAGDLRRASDHLPVLLEVAWQPAGL